ncbi:MAG: WYL domain-containing protein, partial [Clostridia bacterium]|nr:WYL domain-containing protein [Clostridia bacterium]
MNDLKQPKKLLILYILDILRRYSDEEHRLSQKQIADILAREYSMKVNRKAVKANLLDLMDFGYEIEYSEATRTSKAGEAETLCTDFRLVHDFSPEELMLLS